MAPVLSESVAPLQGLGQYIKLLSLFTLWIMKTKYILIWICHKSILEDRMGGTRSQQLTDLTKKLGLLYSEADRDQCSASLRKVECYSGLLPGRIVVAVGLLSP